MVKGYELQKVVVKGLSSGIRLFETIVQFFHKKNEHNIELAKRFVRFLR